MVITIGEHWLRKRGRRHLPERLTVRQIHRADRLAEVRDETGARRSMPFTELRRNYRRAGE